MENNITLLLIIKYRFVVKLFSRITSNIYLKIMFSTLKFQILQNLVLRRYLQFMKNESFSKKHLLEKYITSLCLVATLK